MTLAAYVRVVFGPIELVLWFAVVFAAGMLAGRFRR